MKSSFIDSMKLILSDKYEISDKDYLALSDILLSQGLSSKDSFDNGLVGIIKIMIQKGIKFPLSFSYMKDVWEEENSSFRFVPMIGELVRINALSLRKVSKEVFLKSENINKSSTENYEKDVFVTIYGTPIFNAVLNKFQEILVSKEKKLDVVMESTNLANMPKVVKNLVEKARKLLDGLHMGIEVESFEVEDVLRTVNLNLNIKDVSKYQEADLIKTAKKYIKGVSELEIYNDFGSVFLGFKMDMDIDSNTARKISEGIYTCFEVLEVGEE